MKLKLLQEPGESGLSLAPGLSRVMKTGRWISRFNGLPAAQKPLKRLENSAAVFTWLKPGANERAGGHGGRLWLRGVALGCLALALAAFLPAASAQLAPSPAPALLAPAQGIVPAAAPAAPLPGVVRSQFTGVDPAVIQQLQSKQVTKVRLPMFAHGERTLIFTGREDFGPGRFALTGTLNEISPSSAVLAVWDGAVTLDVHGYAEKPVRLRNAGNGGYWLEETDPAAQGKCGVDDHAPPGPIQATPLAPAPGAANTGAGFTPAAADGNLWADLLAYYTPLARDAAGGEAAMSSLIASRVATANAVHSGSDTLFRIRLVRISLMDYSGFTDSDDLLTKLSNSGDGVMDNVFADIAEFGADLTHLWATYSDGGTVNGRGQLGGAFGVNRWDQPQQTFTHESGHNLGCRHQASGGVNPDPAGPFQHAIQVCDAICLQTGESIMWGSSTETRLDRFSSPLQTVNFPLGGSATLGSATADNRRYVIENRTTTVRRKEPRFYVAPGGDGQATPYSPANNLTSVYDAWYFNTWGQTAINPVVVRVAAGNIPAPALIGRPSRLEKWGGGGNARITR